jgi:hypothetical protein
MHQARTEELSRGTASLPPNPISYVEPDAYAEAEYSGSEGEYESDERGDGDDQAFGGEYDYHPAPTNHRLGEGTSNQRTRHDLPQRDRL